MVYLVMIPMVGMAAVALTLLYWAVTSTPQITRRDFTGYSPKRFSWF